MPTLYMDWGGDLQQSLAGGLRLATLADSVRQMITRELLTTPAMTLPSGQAVAPEFYYDPTFGQGLRVLVGQDLTPDVLGAMIQRITHTVLKTPGVNAAIPPTVSTTSNNHETTVTVEYVLANGSPARMAFSIG